MKSEKNQNATSAASVFKAIDNVLKKLGCGCSGSLDYMEQSSWLLFLRYLDAREEERKLEALYESDLAEFEKLARGGGNAEGKHPWPMVRLGDVCEVRAGANYKDVEDPNGRYPIYGTGGIMGYASQYRCPAHSVIVGRLRDHAQGDFEGGV